uniref:Large ribosomal subunit protein uL13 n=1 Tax=uncultured Armatimonadetes bacterium TaxID=157466 RepID=A0A6J4JPF4_9BACT|nr:LSU ribosomal protein L13p (L13Ae) [uncultured Armatimonadetes bacterium]
MKTYSAKPSEIQRDWVVLDATGVPVGRLSVEAAKILRGKHKPTFTPHMDTGDHVIIINAERAIYTGNNKADEPIYRHTLYPGGIRSVPRGEFLTKRPEDAILRTVKGMLPHNSLGAQMLRKLRVYRGPEHRHEAQIKGAQARKTAAGEATE